MVERVTLRADAKTDGAARRAAVDRFFRCFQCFKNGLRGFEQLLSCRRQDHLLVDAKKQPHAEPAFDIAQLMAERRLRQMKNVSGFGQALTLSDRRDKSQVTNLEIHHISCLHKP